MHGSGILHGKRRASRRVSRSRERCSMTGGHWLRRGLQAFCRRCRIVGCDQDVTSGGDQVFVLVVLQRPEGGEDPGLA